MGSISGKRGGSGGKNAPPDIYTGFFDIGDDTKADPIGAVSDGIKFLVLLLIFGLFMWVAELLGKHE